MGKQCRGKSASSIIHDSVIPVYVSVYSLYLTPESNLHVIHDSVIPFSVITHISTITLISFLYIDK